MSVLPAPVTAQRGRVSEDMQGFGRSLLRALLACLPLGFVSVSAPLLLASEAPPAPGELAKAAHALNRLGYGPRPGEIERVAAGGVEAWMRAQLVPSTLPDPVADAELAKLERLRLPAEELVAAYQREIRERQRLQRERATEDAAKMEATDTMMRETPPADAAPDAPVAELAAASTPPRGADSPDRLLVAETLGELQHAKLARAVLSERQLEQVLVDFWFNHFNVDARKQQVRATVVSHEQDVVRPHVFGTFRELLGATAKSGAMLVYLDNFRSSREQDVGPVERRIAERVKTETLGLDAADAAATTPSRRGLNENYGRELLELHTLGVDGGYTQKDVQEVARAFTGWTIDPQSGEFRFRRQWHDNAAKTVLGTTLPAGGGQTDGEKVLDLLATHPATARHLAFKLCQRFINDTPPETLVTRVADVFLQNHGDLRATYEAIFFSPEFFAAENLRAKTKSPFEFLASSLRASGADLVEVTGWRGRIPLRAIEAGATLGRGGDHIARLPRKTALLHLVEMGQSPYAWGPPTGFPEDSSTWVSAGALVSRLNFTLALTGGQVADARIDTRRLLADAPTDGPDALVDHIARDLFGAPPSDNTRRVLLAEAAPSREGETAVPDVPKLLALMLGSPEFQRR